MVLRKTSEILRGTREDEGGTGVRVQTFVKSYTEDTDLFWTAAYGSSSEVGCYRRRDRTDWVPDPEGSVTTPEVTSYLTTEVPDRDLSSTTPSES